ncbi:MAG: type IV secretion system DNA-binding domain-containing protein [Burkholderiaceae bacterium]|nr:type IV secretion system DNA-binding domain-containing protein [Burkholderiaceae bacterium]
MTIIFALFLVASLAAAKIFWADRHAGDSAFLFKMCAEPLMFGYLFVFGLTGSFFLNVLIGWMVGAVIMGILTKMKVIGRRANADGSNVLRGSNIVSAGQARKYLEDQKAPWHIELGGVPVPEAVENLNFLFAGAPGSGKTQAFYTVLESVRKRSQSALVTDMGGGFISRFFREDADKILNPFDSRGQVWCPFAEMRNPYDAARLAASMIPVGGGDAKEWNGYARAVLETILERCFESGNTSNQALCYYTLGADSKELKILCRESTASPYFEAGNERMLGSIRGILSTYLKPYTYLKSEAGRDAFSIRRHIESGNDSWLFLSYRNDQLQAIRPMVAAQIDIAASAILSMQSQLSRRVWFSMDEFSSLGLVNSILPLLSTGRQFGVCAVLGLQSISQSRSTVGHEDTQTLLACLGTWLVLRQPDHESADYMSKHFGKQDIVRNVSSENKTESGKSTGSSEQYAQQDAVLSRELQELSPLHGILDISGPMPPAHVTLKVSKIAATQPTFVDLEGEQCMRITKPRPIGSASSPISFDV